MLFYTVLSSLAFASSAIANIVDEQYTSLMKNILQNGEVRQGRNGETLSLFAPPPLSFDVSHEAFPLITTKKVNLRLIAEELFWFVSGSSDVKDLQDKNVKIWNANALPNGQAGMYGINWRSFGADFRAQQNTKETIHKPLGVDQLAEIIDSIMNNPTSRRIFLSAWNPIAIKENPDVLPPCHVSMQFYVRADGILDMMVYQRSVDVPIGLNFNITSYSLLLLMISHVTDKVAGKITYVMGDTHIYQNTLRGVEKQIVREPYPLPRLYFESDIPRGSGLEGLLQFRYRHLRLENYQSHPPIHMVMSA